MISARRLLRGTDLGTLRRRHVMRCRVRGRRVALTLLRVGIVIVAGAIERVGGCSLLLRRLLEIESLWIVGPLRGGLTRGLRRCRLHSRRTLRCSGWRGRWLFSCRRTTTRNRGNSGAVIPVTLLGHRHHRVAVQLQVQVVELFGLGAVHLIDAFADARLLVEHRSVQAEELDVHGLVQLPDRAHVEHLARGLQVCVVAANHLTGAREIRLGEIVEVEVLERGGRGS